MPHLNRAEEALVRAEQREAVRVYCEALSAYHEAPEHERRLPEMAVRIAAKRLKASEVK